MKPHIDALFDYLDKHANEFNIKILYELFGILYEIGSQWEYYKELLGDEQ